MAVSDFAKALVTAVGSRKAEDRQKADVRRGDFILYSAREAEGEGDHLALVTRVIDADTVNATVFFDGSAPAARQGLKLSAGHWAAIKE